MPTLYHGILNQGPNAASLGPIGYCMACCCWFKWCGPQNCVCRPPIAGDLFAWAGIAG